jgi:hypothetical protein
MTLILVLTDIVAIPFRKYYHWDDPLKTEVNKSDGSISNSESAELEKEKYQTRLQPSVFDGK